MEDKRHFLKVPVIGNFFSTGSTENHYLWQYIFVLVVFSFSLSCPCRRAVSCAASSACGLWRAFKMSITSPFVSHLSLDGPLYSHVFPYMHSIQCCSFISDPLPRSLLSSLSDFPKSINYAIILLVHKFKFLRFPLFSHLLSSLLLHPYHFISVAILLGVLVLPSVVNSVPTQFSHSLLLAITYCYKIITLSRTAFWSTQVLGFSFYHCYNPSTNSQLLDDWLLILYSLLPSSFASIQILPMLQTQLRNSPFILLC